MHETTGRWRSQDKRMSNLDDMVELTRLERLLAARTNGGDPKRGYKANVAVLRTRINDLRTKMRLAELPPAHPTTETPPADLKLVTLSEEHESP